jgi:hypothetical protein
MFRIRFDVGDFYCYTVPFYAGKSAIDLKEDLTIDINDAKYIKLSLISIKGRGRPHNQYVNEFVNEEVISFVSLKIRDFEDSENNSDILHNLIFGEAFYNPNVKK